MAVRRRHVAKAARTQLERAGVTTAPVDVNGIAKGLGATVSQVEAPDDLSGFLARRPGARPVIGVNSKHSSTRQRFTLAHEIGHLLLHVPADLELAGPNDVHIDRRDRVSSEGIDDAEREANLFAAELLMPEELIRSAVGAPAQVDPSDEIRIQRLAKTFGVSSQAMTFRLMNLGIIRS